MTLAPSLPSLLDHTATARADRTGAKGLLVRASHIFCQRQQNSGAKTTFFK